MLRRTHRNTAPHSPKPTPITLLSNTGFSQHHTSTPLSRWRTFLSLPAPSEYFISVDHHQIWRRHLAWSHREGDTLKNAVTSRFASNMVFMSLLLGAEISTLFSPSRPAQLFREALAEAWYHTVYFWGGIFLCISIGLTLSTLLANFTAWAIIGAVSSENSHAVLRSSIGLYAAQLPARMAVLSIYCFVIWIVLFLVEILAAPWSWIVAIFTFVMVVHIVVVYSAFGRLVMYSKAMRKVEIFHEEEEDSMTANRLFEELLKKAMEEKELKTPLPLYYRQNAEIRRQVSKLMDSFHISNSGFGEQNVSAHLSKILESPGRGLSGGTAESPDIELGNDKANRNHLSPLELPRVGSEANGELANIAKSLGSIGLDKSEDDTHPLKRNSCPSGGRGHRRESSGIAMQRSLPQSPAF